MFQQDPRYIDTQTIISIDRLSEILSNKEKENNTVAVIEEVKPKEEFTIKRNDNLVIENHKPDEKEELREYIFGGRGYDIIWLGDH